MIYTCTYRASRIWKLWICTRNSTAFICIHNIYQESSVYSTHWSSVFTAAMSPCFWTHQSTECPSIQRCIQSCNPGDLQGHSACQNDQLKALRVHPGAISAKIHCLARHKWIAIAHLRPVFGGLLQRLLNAIMKIMHGCCCYGQLNAPVTMHSIH